MTAVARLASLATLVVALAALTFAPPGHAATGTAGDHDATHTDANGAVSYQVHVPPQQATGRPLPVVVALHGCTMTGSALNSMKDLTALNALADREGFLVVYPSQSILRNALLCWNALDPAHQHRATGEPALLAGMTQDVLRDYDGDRSRVHVLGASSGAGTAVILGVTYPDVFATATSMAGGEYAVDQADPENPDAVTPQDTAEKALAEMGPRARAVPLLVGQGDADTTVDPLLADRLVSQFATIDTRAGTPVDDVADRVEQVDPPGKQSYTHSSYAARDGGRPLIEKYLVHGMGHAWPGPGTGPFADGQGPDLTRIFWDFARDRRLP
ncbi:extracellular catalytic domain type 1 short-chain-length polyhydroxyalkanoate depolymerase [Actinomycetospora termitidis]|uniref:PHB depolymerase family esterase n=1 Tax=Actinomycetospora termitidis TaxID=3053470 RepID=A0ABT7MJF2_9PSEU|nr:PHB depolymerase family esterase [Actinomycetospora sp. Odt1-22]MDL5160349.1 PHB depolymerase family esterase [Actinomycetospora sp. Odt1-22]